ncbi:DHA2 family efflux MFS transporter permease subunit [Ralstonia pseudosolanacearum]|uniref:DHA2 family efflux MFS transporter permease subunit n=1 Tax=Ralstonia pseudosolanacearum TaxID=1310165 RepID=UPI00035B7BD3|nr:DHA2 family efflux MFS transporter permease subunit [Ralstonia pseudosolanacearum]AOE89457.1 putative transport protein HsrA [Ralstonia solanacearum]APF87246.1 MFS transporter [Ralstonia solanacearum FJAT-1458]ESS47427.1 multidrug resistance-like efflux transmembrane protein [Ralstonia solanacearum SD54]AXV69321.1 MFS transporter [Ralstonia solanacearum]AXV95942.1 MFS transporter [Ralstonia solanacearum]
MATFTPTLETLRARHGERFKWLVLFTLTVGAVSSIISATIVNVAIPDLSRHFVLGQERAQWVSASFMVAMTLAMLLTPWLLLRFGLRRTFIGALLLLGVGGLVGGLSPTYGVMIAMRVVGGVAAGIMQPLPNILILRVFPEREQGKAFGLFGFGVVLAPALGPSLGGFLVELFGWRSIFFVVVPFTLLGWAMARRFMAINSSMAGEPKPLDWRGLLLVGAATVALLNGLVELHADATRGVALMAVSAVCLAVFLFWQRRVESPLLDLRLFSYRQFAMGAVVAFIYGAGLYGSTYLLPVYMQVALAYTPSSAGLVLLPPGLALAATIVVAGRLTSRIEPYRLVSFGLAALAVSFLLMTTNTRATGYLLLIGIAAIGRVGLGFVLPSLSLGAMRGVDFTLIPQGSSAVNFLRQLGGAIGVSATGIFLQWRLAARGIGAVGGVAVDPEARIVACDETFVFLGVLCALAVAAAWRMRRREPAAVVSAGVGP